MGLKKFPSVIEDNEFNEKGLVVTDSGLSVPVYVGSQFGFNEPGKSYLNDFFYPKLEELGILPLCPFSACEEYLNLSQFKVDMTVQEQTILWNEFNKIIGKVNYETLMPKAKFMIALLDGSHPVDDGLSAEVAYFAERYGRVLGIRSDIRISENPDAPINPAVRYFIDLGPFGGKFFIGPSAYDRAFREIKILADEIRNE